MNGQPLRLRISMIARFQRLCQISEHSQHVEQMNTEFALIFGRARQPAKPRLIHISVGKTLDVVGSWIELPGQSWSDENTGEVHKRLYKNERLAYDPKPRIGS